MSLKGEKEIVVPAEGHHIPVLIFELEAFGRDGELQSEITQNNK